jgi:lysozyme
MIKALEIIKNFEKCKLKAYQDGGGVWTCGWGSTGPDINEHTEWTQEEADKRLVEYFEDMWKRIQKSILYPDLYNENQKAAICSLAYNIGNEAFAGSTLRRKMNALSPILQTQAYLEDLGNEFLKWDWDNGKREPGLLARRRQERALFLEVV